MKKISLNINGRNYDIDLEDKFANFLEKQIEKDFHFSANNDHKKVLQAYVSINHELFEIENKIDAMSETFDALKKTLE